jgi:hypothetical protein
MTEAEWLACSDLDAMLRVLRQQNPWTWTTRKARFFASACCRRVWDLLPSAEDRQAIEMVEEVAEKQRRPLELGTIRKSCQAVSLGPSSAPLPIDPSKLGGGAALEHCVVALTWQRQMMARPAYCAADPKPWGDPDGAANDVRALLHFRLSPEASGREMAAQCDLLREVVGLSPQRPTLNPYWLVWDHGTVVQLAQAAYDDRELPGGRLDSVRMTILAESLEEAGCTEETILAHCRSGSHVRGCWVLDLLLGNK